jgi:hypothetical protein
MGSIKVFCCNLMAFFEVFEVFKGGLLWKWVFLL